jgi:transcriptional regulator with XRE-family HTH domain
MDDNFGKNLRKLRKKKNLTLLELGNILNISKSALSDYENGKSTPSLTILDQISKFFGKNINELTSENIDTSERNNEQQSYQSSETVANYFDFENKLLQQQISNLEMQILLIKQLLDSKDAHIQALNLQIKLLEEKLKTKY